MNAPPVLLYVGETRHRRIAPVAHAFRYRLFWLSIDIDRLDEADGASRWLSVDRFNLYSFHRRDHGAREDTPLRPWAEARFADAGIDLDGGSVRLIALPRMLGYAFKPLSVWFGHGPDGALRGVIYEVNNTFGDTHAYVCPIAGASSLKHAAHKIFHVSPFFDARGEYEFRLRPLGEEMALGIRYSVDRCAVFTASQRGRARKITDAALLQLTLAQPMVTLKVIAGIHGEALQLWRKGVRYRRRPSPSLSTGAAAKLKSAIKD
ncbi:MAG: DUF1365 domain-containing protein [Maricaulaceae bacterium]|jgi:DUF1365 family protein